MRIQFAQIEEDLKKKFEFLTGVISRVEREFQTASNAADPKYKPSAIKYSNTAIVLRFI
jgi:hypothetical protein